MARRRMLRPPSDNEITHERSDQLGPAERLQSPAHAGEKVCPSDLPERARSRLRGEVGQIVFRLVLRASLQGCNPMWAARIARPTVLTLIIGAVPVGAIVWLLASPGWGVATAIAVLLMGASIYSLSPPRPQSRPGKPDPGDLSNAPTFGGRGEVKASELWARPLRYRKR
jgi:hypothetical protein